MMKKVISLILALMLVLGMSVSSHAETTDETKQMISFRGIPWGCSPDAALEMLEEQFGEDSIKVTRTDSPLRTYPYCQYDEDSDSVKVPIPMLIYRVDVENCKVAGYDTEYLLLYFIPELSEDEQSYDLSETAGKFWHARYMLSRPDTISTKEMRADLSDKISTLYKGIATGAVKTMKSFTMKSVKTSSGLVATKETHECPHRIWSDEFSQLEMCGGPESGTKLIYKCNFRQYGPEAWAIKTLIDQKGAAAKQAERQKRIEESQKRIEDAVGTGTDGL